MSENILLNRTLEHFEAVRTKDLAAILSVVASKPRRDHSRNCKTRGRASDYQPN